MQLCKLIVTHRRSIVKQAVCFQWRLFICGWVCLSTW